MPTPVYLVAGQSNAYSLNGGNGGVSVSGQFAALTGSDAVVVKSVTADGAPLTWGRPEQDWYHPEELADQLVSTIRAALADPDAYLGGILWIQGEGDTWSFARSGEYATRLTALVDYVEHALAPYGDRTADFRFSLLSLSADCPASSSKANWTTVRNQQLSLHDPRIDVINVDTVTAQSVYHGKAMFQADGLHYTAGANDPILTAMLDRTPVWLDGDMGDNHLTGLSGNDTMRGGAGYDLLEGGDGNDLMGAWTGNDTLIGGYGNDTLTGWAGSDALYGGAGADRFVFNSARDSYIGACDVIGDFQPGADRIQLTGIDADPTRDGNQTFRFLGTAAFDHHPGALHVLHPAEGMAVSADLDGDGVSDFYLRLTGLNTLTEQDFFL